MLKQRAFKISDNFNYGLTILSVFAATLFLEGCATGSKHSEDVSLNRGSATKTTQSGLNGVVNSANPSAYHTPVDRLTDSEKTYTYRGLKISQKDYDFPIQINDSVAFWIDYFSGRGRGFFEKYLQRSELFIPYIQPILKQYGIPQDLVYLAMIESGFANHAKSQARAVGPWQFMPMTGKRYGLEVDWWVDERRDTEKSTHAAAKYLKDLYKMFDSWELAASGYNAGEMKIVRAIQRYATTDYWSITRQNFLRRETRDYVPKIMAAAIVSKNREFFGFTATAKKPEKGEVLAPNGEVVKVENSSTQASAIEAKEALESVIKSEEVTPKDLSKDSVLQKKEKIAQATLDDEGEIEEEAEDPDDQLLASGNSGLEKVVSLEKTEENSNSKARPVQTPHVNRNGELVGEDLAFFEIDGPADLMKIARASGLSYHTVKGLNPEILRWCTPPHLKKYVLRLPVSVKEEFLKTYNSKDFPKRTEFLTFRVNKPQSLALVARRFGLKADPLADLNKIPSKMILRKGTLVRLPIPAEGDRNLAALDLKDPPEKRRSHSKKHRRKRAAAQHKVSSLYERSQYADRRR